MISIDRQPWAHRGGPAFVTSKLNPIADPHRSLMNWPCSPSLFNWWRVHFQVHHHYVPRTHWFSKKHPHRSSYFFSLFSVGTLLHTIIAPWLALSSITRGISFSLHFTAHVVFKKWICKSEGEFAHSGGVLQNYTHTKIHKTVFFFVFFFLLTHLTVNVEPISAIIPIKSPFFKLKLIVMFLTFLKLSVALCGRWC